MYEYLTDKECYTYRQLSGDTIDNLQAYNVFLTVNIDTGDEESCNVISHNFYEVYQNFTFVEAFPTGVLDLQVSYYIYSDYITSIGDTNFTISADRYGEQIIFIKNGDFQDELTLRWRALGY